jgi:hypothetical protein
MQARITHAALAGTQGRQSPGERRLEVSSPYSVSDSHSASRNKPEHCLEMAAPQQGAAKQFSPNWDGAGPNRPNQGFSKYTRGLKIQVSIQVRPHRHRVDGMIYFIFVTVFHFRQRRFATVCFLDEDSRIEENRLRKLHYRFSRDTCFESFNYLESQHLQSYDGLLQYLA